MACHERKHQSVVLTGKTGVDVWPNVSSTRDHTITITMRYLYSPPTKLDCSAEHVKVN